MKNRLTRRGLLFAWLAAPLLGGCGGGSGPPALGSSADGGGRGTLALTMNFQASRAAKPRAGTRAFGGFIPIGTRAVVVAVTNSTTGAALAPSQLIAAPLSGPGAIPTVVPVEFTGLPVGPVTVTATAYPDAAVQGVPIATGMASGHIVASSKTNLSVTFTLTLSKLTASPASVTVDPFTTGAIHTAQVTATVADASGRALVLPIYWLSQDPGVAQVTFDPDSPGTATITAVAEGRTVVTLVEPNSGMTAAVAVLSTSD
jgi:hypothetical protein